MKEVYLKARGFIYRNARPLDLARFRFHFEAGKKEDVLSVLSYYQNADGGFGHALEPDAWNPASSPIQTWAATEILREIEFFDGGCSLIKGILDYLENTPYFDGHFWANIIPSNNLHPHAPWWRKGEDAPHDDYNPTAALAGFILRCGRKGSALHVRAREIVQNAISDFLSGGFLENMHTAACYLRMAEYLEAAGESFSDIGAFREKIKAQISYSVEKRIELWNSYVCRPSLFMKSKSSPLHSLLGELAEYECEFILKTQAEDGSWPVPWSWDDYPEAWAVSKNWWKADIIIKHLLFLKGIGRI